MAGAAARFIGVIARHSANNDEFIVGACGLAVTETLCAGRLITTHHADRREFRHLIGKSEQLWNGREWSAGEILIESAHNDRARCRNNLFNDGGEIWAKELRLFNRYGIWIEAGDLIADCGCIRRYNARESGARSADDLARGNARVTGGSDQQHALSCNLTAGEEAHDLSGFATAHAASDHVEPGATRNSHGGNPSGMAPHVSRTQLPVGSLSAQ